METKETRCHPKSAVNATCLLGNKGCYENGKCHYIGNCEHKVLTNADRIRAMSDEQLAKVIICPKQVCDKLHILVGRTDCEACSLEWLKQPADMRGEEDAV